MSGQFLRAPDGGEMNPIPPPRRCCRRILLVDDHPVVRRGLAQLINQEEDMEVCGEAVDCTGALALIGDEKPDLAVVDLSLRGSDGLDLLKGLKQRRCRLPVLVLSMHDESVYAERALRAGASGYIMKQEALERVLQAIRVIFTGEVYLSEKMQARLLRAVSATSADSEVPPMARLSNRELEVFQLIGQGLTTGEIGRHLNLSVKTVETHCSRIKEKLGIKSATELLQSATLWVASETAS